MKHIGYRRTATVFLAIMVVTMLAPPCHAQFIPYDIFTAGVIDPDKWQGISTEGSASRPAAEVLRTAEDGAFRARLVGWGDNTSNMGSFVTRQGLNIVQLGTYGTSGYINGLKAKVTVLETDVQHCLTSQESNAPALAQAQLIATFFNDGTSPAAGDTTGDILGIIELRQNKNGARSVFATVNRIPSNGAPSSTPIAVGGNPVTFNTPWSLNKPLVLQMKWDQVGGKIKFVVTDPDPANPSTETVNVTYLGSQVVEAGPPITDFKSVRVRNTAENCAPDRKRTMMDATFDNINVKRVP